MFNWSKSHPKFSLDKARQSLSNFKLLEHFRLFTNVEVKEVCHVQENV